MLLTGAGFKQTVIKQLAGIKEELRANAAAPPLQLNGRQLEESLIIDRPALPLMTADQLIDFEEWLAEQDKYNCVVSVNTSKYLEIPQPYDCVSTLASGVEPNRGT